MKSKFHVHFILSKSPADIQWELRKLLLANVTLSKVGKLLEKIRRLEVLDLSGNQLESISEPEFIAFAPNLRVLRLGGNRLTKIDSKTFKGMNLLESLLLAGNRLKSMDYETQEEFPDDLLDKLPLLATLDLSNNLFTYIPEKLVKRFSFNSQLKVFLKDNRYHCDWKVAALNNYMKQNSQGSRCPAEVRYVRLY